MAAPLSQAIRVLSAVGALVRVFSWFLLIPIAIALAYEPWDTPLLGMMLPRNAIVFFGAFVIAAAFWIPENLITRHVQERDLTDRAAYLTVAIGWLVLCLFGMTPFLLSGSIPGFSDAFFETMSGLTTTGSSVLHGVYEDVPESIHFWRALLQFIGGMGVIVLGVAVLSRMTQGGASLMAAETPGPTASRLAPKLAETARTLWRIYFLFSAALFAILLPMLLAQGTPFKAALYDAVLHTFTTMSTGGYSNHSASIAAFDSIWIEGVLIVFMLIAATSFTLHHRILQGSWRKALRDTELRFMLITFAAVTVVATGLLWHAGTALGEALRGAAFVVASILSTTGFGTVDFDQWPDAVKLLLFVLMLTGGSAGSTSGGLKFLRILILFKIVRREVNLHLHPRAVVPIRVDGAVVPDKVLWRVVSFFFLFVTVWLVGALAITTTDSHLGLIDGASAAASAIGNIGPAFGVVGPTQDYAFLDGSTKLILSGLMWLGRLEIFTVLLVFSPRAWR